jgi:type II secretory pathway pseudopilin PulG
MANMYAPVFANKLLVRKCNSSAFALIDAIVAAILLVIMTASLQSLFEVSRQGILLSNALDQADRDIHTVMNSIRQLGLSYHYCGNKGTASTQDCSQSSILLGTNPQSYYSTSAAELQNFKNDCNFDAKGNINDDKILNGGDGSGNSGMLGALKNLQTSQPLGVSIVSYVQDNKENRRIKVTLSKNVTVDGANRTLTRQYYFSPMLSLWCP